MKKIKEIAVISTETINIDPKAYTYNRPKGGRWIKKVGQKDMAVRDKFPEAEIYMLYARQINTKGEKALDNLLGFLTDAPFGTPELINSFKNANKEFYLVDCGTHHSLVVVTDDTMYINYLEEKTFDKKFKITPFQFQNLGQLKR